MRLRFSGRALASLVPVLGLTLTAACHRHDTGGHSHGSAPADAGGHAHEEKTFQITVWAEGYEVFAEHQPVVAGTSTTFITHVTDLNTFEPRIEGSVRFVMRHAEETREHPQAQPDRAGIYLPDIVFPRPGEWQLSLAIPNNGGEAVVPLGSIYAYGDAHDAAHANVPEAPEGVSFLKEQQWKIQARTEPGLSADSSNSSVCRLL